jgi:hypothetical protein
VEIFSKRISMPIMELSLAGFSESKMPEDQLYSALFKEINLKKRRFEMVTTSRFEQKQMKFYSLDIDYSIFKKTNILYVTY